METREVLLWWISVASAVTFLATPVIIATVIVRLPTDYFIANRHTPLKWPQRHPLLRWINQIGKNLVGVVLLLAGLMMLIVPGQGLLTIVVGLMLIDFPGKTRLLLWLATRPAVWRAMNWLRKRAGRSPFERP